MALLKLRYEFDSRREYNKMADISAILLYVALCFSVAKENLHFLFDVFCGLIDFLLH